MKIKNIWLIISIVLFLLLIGSVLTNGFGLKNLIFKNSDKVAQTTLDYINKNLLAEGYTASLEDSQQLQNGLYKIKFKVEDQEVESYVSSDGKLLFLQGIEMVTSDDSSSSSEDQEIPKADKPTVQLFVMSYCPYGLQAEKMYLPVLDLLKDKVDMSVHFVNYAMHEKKELDENLRQYCIQKEQADKYFAYLTCFVKAGDYDTCLNEVGIDKTKMDACVAETDQQYNITSDYNDKSTWLSETYPTFNVENDLNEKYSVQGSPTIVINGTVVDVSPRSPEKFKEVVCQAFNTEPAECSQKLSEGAASTGFGEEETNSSDEGSCE
jgi:protein-disulfide isomerase